MKFLQVRLTGAFPQSSFHRPIGFVPHMNCSGYFYVNQPLEDLMFEELKYHCQGQGFSGFLPAVKQIANVAALPGIVKGSFGLPDVHSGILLKT